MNISRKKLDRALNPKTIAVVGDKGKRDYMWLKTMSTFAGKVFSVQTDPKEIPGIEQMGVRNYKSLMEIPEEIDYVVIAVPMQACPMVLKDCIQKNVGGVSMFTSGFAESGTPEGMEMQQTIAKMAKEAGMVLLGPNCMGVYNPKIGLRFLPDQPTGGSGTVSFLSQSGGHADSFSLAARANGIGINKIVSLGNGAVLESTDFLDYFSQDEETKIIAIYIEDVKDGPRFFRLLRETAPRKPVIMWKGGRTEEGNRAASSHTGALAGTATTWDTIIKQCGVIGVNSMEQMMDVAKALIYLPKTTGNAVGVIGWSGGQSVQVTDTFSSMGLRVPLLQEESNRKFGKIFRSVGASCKNPIDFGAMNDENMAASVEIVAQDPNIDIVAIQFGGVATFGGRIKRNSHLIEVMVRARDKMNKPFVALFLSPDPYTDGKALGDLNLELQQAGIPAYLGYERAAYALKKVGDYYRFHAGDGVTLC